MIGSDGENLVFLFSTPRAGSTLVSAILSSHRDVACPNEPWFLLGLASLYEGGNITHARYEHRGVEQALRELVSEDEFLQAARAFALTVYGRCLEREDRRVFVDKTPRYFHITSFIERLFPQAKKIWLKRNPLDVAVSYRNSWSVSVDELLDPEFGPMALDLTVGLRSLGSYFDSLPGALELRYEDLVADPAREVRRLCDFIGIEHQPDLEVYGREPRILERRRKGSMGDRKVFDDSRPHTRSVGQWEESLDPGSIQSIIATIGEQIFVRMGYAGVLEALHSAGYWFPDEQTVDGKLSAFVNSAKWLPWAARGNPAE